MWLGIVLNNGKYLLYQSLFTNQMFDLFGFLFRKLKRLKHSYLINITFHIFSNPKIKWLYL